MPRTHSHKHINEDKGAENTEPSVMDEIERIVGMEGDPMNHTQQQFQAQQTDQNSLENSPRKRGKSLLDKGSDENDLLQDSALTTHAKHKDNSLIINFDKPVKSIKTRMEPTVSDSTSMQYANIQSQAAADF